MVFLLIFRLIFWSRSISKMGKENLIHFSMSNFVVVTAIQPEQVHIGHAGSITYTHSDLIHIRENCKYDQGYKKLGYNTCKNVGKLRLNRRIARGSRLKYNQHRRQQMLNSRFMDMTNLIYPVSRTCTTIINEGKKVSISIMNSQSIRKQRRPNTMPFNGQESQPCGNHRGLAQG